jgi:hypothetical protein
MLVMHGPPAAVKVFFFCSLSTFLDTAGSFAKAAYIRDWIQLDININLAFPVG